jgi:hypothetical protein
MIVRGIKISRSTFFGVCFRFTTYIVPYFLFSIAYERPAVSNLGKETTKLDVKVPPRGVLTLVWVGMDLALFGSVLNRRQNSMAITSCPMCQSSLPVEGVKACMSCGADLSRWMPKPPPIPKVQAAGNMAPEAAAESNLGRGILGAVAGAILGSALMYGFYAMVGFRFPWLGLGIGALSGIGAKLLNKGADEKLGIISGGTAMAAVVGTLYLIYGEFPIFNIISVIVSVSVAYRIASN